MARVLREAFELQPSLLFGAHPVIIDGQEMPADPPAADPREMVAVSGAVHRRRVEYATGRACARRALRRLKVGDFVLQSDVSRAPIWPLGIVGSITHTGDAPGGYCGVAVAAASDIRALGFDAETGDALFPHLWSEVLTAGEARRMAAIAPAARTRLIRLVFSAKESFFKAQFPLTRSFLGFQDLEVAVDEKTFSFEVSAVGAAASGLILRSATGRYVDLPQLVVTGVAVPA